MEKKYSIAVWLIGFCVMLWLGATYLPDYTSGWVKSYHGLEKQGIFFTEPYLVVYGKKDRDIKLTLWTRYSTMDGACRGAFIMESDQRTTYSPGSPKVSTMGTAYRFFEIPRGMTDYEVAAV